MKQPKSVPMLLVLQAMVRRESSVERMHMVCTTGWISPERIHPDRAGHEAVATHLAEELRKLGV